MRILVIFSDMLRPNRLSTFNSSLIKQTKIDHFLKNLGGTAYTNCFTEGPDTPRGLASFATGLSPYLNGCDSRLKWPRFFLKKDLDTIYDLLIRNDFKMTFFSNPNERETGLFPDNIYNLNIHNKNYNLKDYLYKTDLEDKHFFFISLPDFHWSLDDYGYTTFGEKKAHHNILLCYKLIFEVIETNEFDHIFIFSDHGFKFNFELKSQPKHLLLNEDRTGIFLFHHQKGDNRLKRNNKLCSITDFYPTIDSIINGKCSHGIPFTSENEKEYVVVEDHIHFLPSVNLNIEQWAVITNDLIYIRNIETAFCLNRKTHFIEERLLKDYDEILKKESSFSKALENYENVFRYNRLILKQTSYMHGGKRIKLGKLLRALTTQIDTFFR